MSILSDAAAHTLLMRIKMRLPHRYAINAKALGDTSALPWSNLGLWSAASYNYPQACQALADHLAQAVRLQAVDRLLDVGCGQGASLLHWRGAYGVQHITGVELQPLHVTRMQCLLPQDIDVHTASFVDLAALPLPVFDTVLCIDAAYHQPLKAFLQGIDSVTHAHSRVGLHHLILTPTWYTLSPSAQHAYTLLLKMADVSVINLLTAEQIQVQMHSYGWQNVQIEDLTVPVLAGFAQFMSANTLAIKRSSWAAFKIGMTAKLCGKLARDGLVRYVQITATQDGINTVAGVFK